MMVAVRRFGLIFVAGCSFTPGTLPGVTDDSGMPIDAPGTGSGDPDAPSEGVSCVNHRVPPSVNVDATQWSASFLIAPAWACTAAGTTTIDSNAGTITSTNCTLGATQATNNVAQLDTAGPSVFVVRLRGLTITNGHVLRMVGNKPVVLLVAGDVVVDNNGVIDAGARMSTPGPGGSPASCVDRLTGHGAVASSANWGGGGGGFGAAGGQGGYDLINGGAVVGNPALSPLRAGCQGGTGNATPGNGQVAGAGGGAFQISASGTITIGSAGQAFLVANGGGAPAFTGGGNGGGAGGGILLVSPVAATFGATGGARAHGGSGSEGSSSGNSNAAGLDGHPTDNNPATDTSGVAGGGNNFDQGRVGGLAYKVGSGNITITPGAMTTAQTGGRGRGGGGGGRIAITAAASTAACD